MQPFGHNRHAPKIRGLRPFWGGELGPHLTQCGQGRGLSACQLPTAKFHLDPSNRLATVHQRYRLTDRTGQTGQDRQDNGPIAYRANHFTNGRPKMKLRQQTSSTAINIAIVKIAEMIYLTRHLTRHLTRQLPPLFGEGAGSPSNTKSPGLSPTFIPSGILMHPAVWSQ